jgi:hypothetical protein
MTKKEGLDCRIAQACAGLRYPAMTKSAARLGNNLKVTRRALHHGVGSVPRADRKTGLPDQVG